MKNLSIIMCSMKHAVKVKSSCEQICYVAAFASSSYASTVYRTGTPFNPLLGIRMNVTDDVRWDGDL